MAIEIEDIKNKPFSAIKAADVKLVGYNNNEFKQISTKNLVELNSKGKIPTQYLDLSDLKFLGVYDAENNIPNISNSIGNDNEYYIVNVPGTQDFGSGDLILVPGDYLIYSGNKWNKISKDEINFYTDGSIASGVYPRVDLNNKNPVNLGITEFYFDGSIMTDAKVDNEFYFKEGGVYLEKKLTGIVYASDFGAVGDGVTDDQASIQKAIDYCQITHKDLYFDKPLYLIGSPLVSKLNDLNSFFLMKGIGKTVFKLGFEGTLLTVGDASYEGSQDGYGFVKIKNIDFDNNGFTNSVAIDVRGQKKIFLGDLYIFGGFTDAIRLKSVYASPEINAVRINGCINGIRSFGQVNNILYKLCAFLACEKGFYADPTSGQDIASGELDTNTFLNCDFEGNQKSIYIDSPKGCQSIRIINNHFENNFGEEIYIANKCSNGESCLISSIDISGNLIYGLHSVTIGNDATGGNVLGSTVSKNFIVGETSNSIKNGKICEEIAFNCSTYDNVFSGSDLSVDLVDHPIAQLSNQKNRTGSGDKLPMYHKTPVEPYGTQAAGQRGDIRYGDNRLWVKTESGWMVSQLQKVPDYHAGNYPELIQSGTTISAKDLKICRTNNFSSAATINQITNGYVGQELTIIGFGDNNTTIGHGSNIRLQGGNDILLGDYDTITLICLEGTIWVEKCRSNNS